MQVRSIGAESRRAVAWCLLGACLTSECASADGPGTERTLTVTATAYNSVPSQTSSEPSITAWGDRLEPGMKVIAVSRDLIELGLSRGVEVEIVGLSGSYVVLDKMAARWKHRIDIYMGEDVGAAVRWGRRAVTIRWRQD